MPSDTGNLFYFISTYYKSFMTEFIMYKVVMMNWLSLSYAPQNRHLVDQQSKVIHYS